MRPVIKATLALLFAFFSSIPAFAGPVGDYPEGAFRNNASPSSSASPSRPLRTGTVPFGCEPTGTRYIDSDKCDGGKCLVQDVDCCGNRRVDGVYYDAVTGVPISQAETCDGQPYCRSTCNYCGDAVLQTADGEQCDLGRGENGRPNSGCSEDCQILPVCGDGEKSESEQCDLGTRNGSPASSYFVGRKKFYCSETCEEINIPICTDGVLNEGERCEPGLFRPEDVALPRKVCTANCQLNYCGDGRVTYGEVCDAGNRNGIASHSFLVGLNRYFCNANCGRTRLPYCGDGIKDANEQCDTGSGLGNSNRTFRVGTKEYYCLNSCRLKEAEKECVWVAQWNIGWINIEGTLMNLENRFKEKRPVPGCFTNWLRACEANRIDWGRPLRTPEALTYKSPNHIAAYVLCGSRGRDGKPTGQPIYQHDFERFLGIPGSERGKWYYYMDENCEYVAPNPNVQLCGYAGIALTGSPISLILEEDHSIESDVRVVDFQLDLSGTKRFSLWKASEKAPLLVFDPKRTGEVKSAEQLFGNWTFGGKTSNPYQPVALNAASKPEPWSNGYEALSVLDLDHNGAVDGAELDVLALWYDRDQDAEVDSGEIRSLTEDGFTALYYRDVTPVAGSRDVQVEVGYARLQNGIIKQGRSIDWFADAYSNQKEALDALALMYPHSGASTAKNSPSMLIPDAVNPTSFKAEENVTGVWFWNFKEDTNREYPGVVTLNQTEKGIISGYGAVEIQLKEDQPGYRSAVKILQIRGELSTTEKGKELRLQYYDPESSSETSSVSILSADGNRMEGSTDQKFLEVSEQGERTASIKYEWYATRAN